MDMAHTMDCIPDKVNHLPMSHDALLTEMVV